MGLTDPSELLFSEPTTQNEEILSSRLFLDVVQRQWVQPGAYPPLSGSDNNFYNVAPCLTEALQAPTIDISVAALASSTIMSSEMEDRKAELMLRKAHQAAAWAVKATTADSFF